jgi:hypothetical protein
MVRHHPGDAMKRFSLVLGLALLVSAPGFAATNQSIRSEAADHPRIVAAIRELEGAIEYMEKAPHDFGGHKAEALRASREAVQQLRKALAYRAKQDRK